MAKGAKQFALECAFCGGKPCTAEDFWPRWAIPLMGDVPTEMNPKYQHTRLYRDGKVEVLDTDKRVGRGRQHDKSYRVCKTCNNGWMSRLQNRAVLEEVFFGDPDELSAEQMRAATVWAVMTAMTADTKFMPELDAVSPEERRAFRGQEVPRAWHVWVGRYAGQQWQAHHHRAVICGITNGVRSRLSPLFSTFGIGQVVFHVASGLPFSLDHFAAFGSTGFKIISGRTAPLPWREAKVFSDDELIFGCTVFEDWAKRMAGIIMVSPKGP